jgi:hypothetical protein
LFAVIVVGIVGIAVIAIQEIKGEGDITGTVSQAGPPVKQDGTPARPYSDANQCSPKTDLVFWPSGRAIPSFPPGISVCFVGDQSFENTGPDRIEVHDR